MFPHSFSLNLLPLPSSGRTGLMVSWGSRFFPSSNFDAAPQPSVTSEMSVPLSVRCGMGDDRSRETARKLSRGAMTRPFRFRHLTVVQGSTLVVLWLPNDDTISIAGEPRDWAENRTRQQTMSATSIAHQLARFLTLISHDGISDGLRNITFFLSTSHTPVSYRSNVLHLLYCSCEVFFLLLSNDTIRRFE